MFRLSIFLSSRLGAALLPALAVEQLTVRALPPGEGLVANLHKGHICARVVMVVHHDVVHSDDSGERQHT